MDELGFNKIAAAVLATALGFMGLKEISHSAMHVSVPDTPAYALEIEVEKPAGGEVIELPFPQPEWIAAMDSERGAKVFKKCTSCHTSDEGAANGTGPNLYNVVGNPAGQKADFKYSATMANAGLTWDYETLDGFLKKPGKYLSGTAMNFVGVKKEADRAAVIEYLRQKSGAPIAPPVAAVQEASLEETVTDVLETAAEGVENAAEAVENTANDLLETVKDAVEDVKNDIDGE